MQGNESFASHVNKNQMKQMPTAESSLITLERAQKLDLLVHLITNLKQSLVLCGPEGIGKTVLLDEFKVRKQDVWPIYAINATSQLSFENFQSQILDFLQQTNGEYRSLDLLSILSGLDKQNKKVVVTIDEAGQLVPGLINTMIQYASSTTCLRIVFSLTHDELHIKNSSDREVDSCHFIDIPPLTKKQCGIYLQNLSAKSDAIISFEAISDRLIDKLYIETHGIPGRIVSELPKLSNHQSVAGFSWISVALIAMVVAIGIGFIIYDDTETDQNRTTSVILKNAEVVEISSPVIGMVNERFIEQEPESDYDQNEVTSSEVIKSIKVAETSSSGIQPLTKEQLKEKPVEQFVDEKEAGIVSVPIATIKSEKNSAVDKVKKIDIVKSSPLDQGLNQQHLGNKSNLDKAIVEPLQVNKPLIIDTLSVPKKTKVIADIAQHEIKATEKKIKSIKTEIVKKASEAFKNNNRWILEQPGKNFTIQLMVLSKHRSVTDFIKNNRSLQKNLKYMEVRKQNQQKYALIYGSFNNVSIASKQMKSLPVKYRKSWIRKFGDLQKEIKK